jgi:hypothetical protein
VDYTYFACAGMGEFIHSYQEVAFIFRSYGSWHIAGDPDVSFSSTDCHKKIAAGKPKDGSLLNHFGCGG